MGENGLGTAFCNMMQKRCTALSTLASHNAGPARVRKLRKEAQESRLDPNVWFGDVEQIASERIGRETMSYVSDIYQYDIACKLVMKAHMRRADSKEAVRAAPR